ncbi:MAG TPA: pyridoxamine 5'-phosphate oxidase family protein, partial [Candidatus Brachybacterium intestinipullorum]|nr:pyridoxamine 5'-phosphate oxidase family protein [Candidatus Brachybacterium intestinipullorum]
MTSASNRLAGERLDYLAGSLADSAPADPLELCDAWLQDAFARRESHGDITDPTAVVLSTVALDADGAPRPRSRTVLLKGLDEHGAVLYTNLESDKALELAATPRAALLLPWYPLQRQVRIEG